MTFKQRTSNLVGVKNGSWNPIAEKPKRLSWASGGYLRRNRSSRGLASLAISWSNIGTKTELVTALTLILAATVFAGVNGRIYGKESARRETLGWSLMGLAILCIIGSFVFRSVGAWSWLLASGLGLAATAWGTRRLVGESLLRSASIGLCMFIPFLVLEGGLLPTAALNSMVSFCNQTTLWYTGVFAEMFSIPFAPTDNGILFVGGEINSAAAFDNFAGILSAVGFSVAISIISRQSLIVSCIGLFFAVCWWLVFRSLTCVWISNNDSTSSYLNSQALSILMFLAMFLVIGATNLGFGAAVSPIPLSSSSELDQVPLTLLYNFVVGFPQLGQTAVHLERRSKRDTEDEDDED